MRRLIELYSNSPLTPSKKLTKKYASFPFLTKVTENTVFLSVTFVKREEKELSSNYYSRRSYQLGKKEENEFITT